MLKIILIMFFFFGSIIFGDNRTTWAENSKVLDDMVFIPKGTFKRGCNRFGPQHGAPEQAVHLDSFWIDKYEVSNLSLIHI